MLKKMKNKDLSKYLLVFLIFLIIGLLTPLTGDDWNNVLHNNTLSGIIEIAKNNYLTFEGRFFSRIFDLIFCSHKYIWAFINAIGMTFIYYCILNFTKGKHEKIMPIIVLAALLLIDEQTFSQIYVWITGNCTYFMPVVFIFFIIWFKRDTLKVVNIKYNKIWYFLLPILSFIFSMFVEPASVGIISVYILIIIYEFVKNKKVDILLSVSTMFSSIGFLLMLNSPGTKARALEMADFNKLNILEKVIDTLPRQINYVFIKNSFLIALFSIVLFILIYKKIKTKMKWPLIIYMIIVPFLTSFSNMINTISPYYPRLIKVFLDNNNIFIIIYWISFLIISILLIYKLVRKDRIKILFFFLVAILNIMAMSISPIGGGRTTFFPTILLYICVFIIMNDIDIKIFENKIFLMFSKIFITFIVMIFILMYSYFAYLDVLREKCIKQQLKGERKTIDVVMLPGKYLWNPNPWVDWHAYTFKLVYNIDTNYELHIVNKNNCECNFK